MSYYVCLNESKKFSTKLKRKWRRRKERGEEAAEQVKPFVNLSEEEKKEQTLFSFSSENSNFMDEKFRSRG